MDYGGTPVPAEKVMVHRTFENQLDIVYDIGLLKLTDNFKFNRMLKPVCLAQEKMDIGGKSLLLAGWGKTGSVNNDRNLLHAYVNGLKDEDCQKFLMSETSSYTNRPIGPAPMVCAKGSTASVCEGDSGGPLTLQDGRGRSTLVGIIAGAVNCSAVLPSVYTSVAFHLRWIKDMLNDPSSWRSLEF
ncbi:clotting factor G beta subunit-like [Rhipicephalus microplus]|uniref:clotting factor G beta subunit-like n=1 Tax=Rhipicephalus microplus TaxID=6941 RepID=UPI003F6C1577